jgi:hypothetical protein
LAIASSSANIFTSSISCFYDKFLDKFFIPTWVYFTFGAGFQGSILSSPEIVEGRIEGCFLLKFAPKLKHTLLLMPTHTQLLSGIPNSPTDRPTNRGLGYEPYHPGLLAVDAIERIAVPGSLIGSNNNLEHTITLPG